MKKPLLIEIGVEELPAIPFLKELPSIKNKWKQTLKEYSLMSDFELNYTPRRIVLHHQEFPLKQDDKLIELYGAPIEIAYKDGKPTNAAVGFAKKCGVDTDELKRSTKGGREVLYYQKQEAGVESSKLLEEMIEKFVESLHFGKSMRWGSNSKSFIRPIRFLGVMLNDKVVECELYGIKSVNKSYGHRSISYEPFEYDSIDEYFKKISESGVVISPLLREEIIKSDFRKIEESSGIKIEIDDELLAEVVAITESPKALLGSFEERFLELPSEVIITSMKEHQRYFPTFKDGALSNDFVVVSNAIASDYDQIIAGNEKVLRSRLSDGLFFYESDLKRGLIPDGLEKITFIDAGGTLKDKVQRERKMANYLVQRFKLTNMSTKVDRAIELSKNDLLTDMVYEFTELQGIMGYYYALKTGEDENVALAIKEQYLPTGEESELPSNDISAVVALSNKLDTLLTLFSLNNIPTGSKDPFALRRAVVGIIKIVLDRGFSFDYAKDIKKLLKDYKEFDSKVLEEFFADRLINYFDQNSSLIKAVLSSGERDLVKISKKLDALDKVVDESDFRSYTQTFKRVANIVKDIKEQDSTKVDTSLLVEDGEKRLYDSFANIGDMKDEGYYERLKELFGLKKDIDSFFDNVMVNVDDEKLKRNRKALINSIYLSFKDIADIKEITI